MEEKILTWPDRIYLQAEGKLHPELLDVTWCQDRVHGNDVEYVRANLVRKQREALETFAGWEDDGDWTRAEMIAEIKAIAKSALALTTELKPTQEQNMKPLKIGDSILCALRASEGYTGDEPRPGIVVRVWSNEFPNREDTNGYNVAVFVDGSNDIPSLAGCGPIWVTSVAQLTDGLDSTGSRMSAPVVGHQDVWP